MSTTKKELETFLAITKWFSYTWSILLHRN